MPACAHASQQPFLLFQVFRMVTGKYTYHNKYYGRRLSADGVKQTLRQFLHNGHWLRVELVRPIIDRLRRLLAMLSKQNTFRFYSSSLLIMYEGADWNRLPPPSSAQPTSSGASDVLEHLPDLNETEKEDDEEDLVDEEACACACRDVITTSSPDPHCDGPSGACRQKEGSAKIDVRMIDFAHATHQGFLQDETSHVGPDHGYLFGLQNLIHLFEEFGDVAASSSDTQDDDEVL